MESQLSASLRARIGLWSSNAVGIYALVASFTVYFSMYAFRKPFSAASYGEGGWLDTDIGLKTAFVVAQLLGYTLSKYFAVKIVSEAPRNRRFMLVVGSIVIAECGLLLFGALPPSLKVVGIFINGLPLGMIWGLMVGYLEGRRTSEWMLAGLSCSFIVASGVVKDIGREFLAFGVEQYWMPALVGAMFFPLLLLSSWALDLLPRPSAEDEAERSARTPMQAGERHRFFKDLAPGLLLLFTVYLGVSAFRDYRDNFGAEIFKELGYGDAPGIFTQSDLPVAFAVLIVMAALGAFHRPRSGLIAVFTVMLLGLSALGLSTILLELQMISGLAWMILIGAGAYFTYVPFSSFLFDRIMAGTRHAGTAVFAINLGDAIGYSGSVILLIARDTLFTASPLGFAVALSYGLSVGGVILLVVSCLYFLSKIKADAPGDARTAIESA